MSILNYRAYSSTNYQAGENNPIAQEPALAGANVTVGGTSTKSAAMPDDTLFVRLAADVACYVEFGADPTAAAGTMYMPAGSVEYVGIAAGDKIAVIEA